jgi:thiol-disulfide isomerase/thioredoxin
MSKRFGGSKLRGGCVDVSLVTLLVLIALLIAVAYYFFFMHNASTPAVQPTAGPSVKPAAGLMMTEHFASSELTPADDEVVVALYSANWCPHCKNYKPTWAKLKEAGGQCGSGKRLRFVDVDCTDGADPSSTTYGVEGYPTIVAISPSKHRHVENRNDIVADLSDF